jgi:hypothetical protein
MRRLVVLLTVTALLAPGALYAQGPGQTDAARADTARAEAEPPPIDAAKLGVSFERIRRELRIQESTETITANGRKLNIRVEVFGQAPPIDFFSDKDFSLTVGPVPNSAPTHREHIEFVTPEEFKSPAADFMGLAVWAAQKLAAKSKKAKCEEEVEAYRRTLMAGIAVTAPRCTQ